MIRLIALLALFKAGNRVADPALWKKRQIQATALGAVIIAAFQLAGSFGYNIPVDEETGTALAAGIIALVNMILTYTTTNKIGVGKEGLGSSPDPAKTAVSASTDTKVGLPLTEGLEGSQTGLKQGVEVFAVDAIPQEVEESSKVSKRERYELPKDLYSH